MSGQKHPLRMAREARHWSIDALAERTGLSRRTLLRAEHGRGLNPSSRQLICRVFDMSAEDLGLTFRQGGGTRPRVASRCLEVDEFDRRDFIHLLSLAGTLLVVPPSLDWERLHDLANHTYRLDEQTMEQYASLHGCLWRSFASPETRGATFRIIQSQLKVLTRHLEQPHGQVMHRRLCALAGDLFQLAGEVFFDIDHYAEAAQCYASAASASKEAGDFDLWACATTRHAFIAIYERRFDTAVRILEVADRLAHRGDESLSTRHWVNIVRAQAFAGLGQCDACEEAVALAEQVEGLSGSVHNGGWLRFDGSRLSEERGACRVELRQPDRAEVALTAALSQGLSPRRQGIVLSDLAIVGAQRHDPDQLVAYSTAALRVAKESDSGVVRRRLQSIRPHLRPIIADARVKEIDRQITRLTRSHHQAETR